ncbi:MAG: SsrA-binding protein SmpB [Firmicutes bacterium]|nr:SsrA-binding protein SmpB [Bacillota bacterium]MDD3298990.1 SsrA-binding protein SmpB [Bacillota bacterium]
MAEDERVVARNKKAHHDYFVEESFEAGIELVGTEVKSIRNGKVNIKDSFARVDNGELYLHNMHISPYEKGNIYNRDPLRTRKLLVHKKEIRKLIGYTQQKGLTLVPLKVYITRGLVKIELAVARGKKNYDKRDDLAKKDAQRKIERAIKERY